MVTHINSSSYNYVKEKYFYVDRLRPKLYGVSDSKETVSLNSDDAIYLQLL